MGPATYAYKEDDEPTCGCWTWYERNPASGVCEPGCVDGKYGTRCTLSAAATLGCHVYDASTTAYLRAEECTAVCRVGYELIGDRCVALPASSSGRSGLSDGVIAAIVLSSVAGAAGAILIGRSAWHAWRMRKALRSIRVVNDLAHKPLVRV